ncbi:MAG: DUF2207 domain-containing protein [candidate division KSB1 bacterium]|nr:DUF2207 domain-containing protein [candidate division KSB1 bacterium]
MLRESKGFRSFLRSLCVRLQPAVTVLLVGVMGVRPLWAAEKRYEIIGVWVDARLNSDGSMDVVEQRQYRFVGRFSWASYELPLAGIGGVENIRVSEGDVEYRLTDSREPGTYSVERSAERLRVRWYYRADNEVRTFTLRFRLLDLVRRHADAAVLYYKFVGTGWDRPSQSVTVRIVPPCSLAREQVQAWAHGPLWGNVSIRDDGSVLADVARLPKRTFWEVRALYPPSCFPEVALQPDSVRATILREEAQWADEANAARQKELARQENKRARKAHGKWLVALLSLGGLLGWWNIYRVYGRRHRVPSAVRMTGTPPSNLPPALVSYLVFDRTVGAASLVATLLDLARRGLLRIHEEESVPGEHQRRAKKPEYVLELDRERARRDTDAGRLLSFERSLLALLFGPLSNGETRLRVEDLKRHRGAMVSFFSQWRKEVTEEAKARNFYEQESLRAMNRSLLLSGLLLLLTVVAGVLVEEWALLLGASTLVVFVLSFAIPRRTPEAEAEAQQWKALARYLKRYSPRAAHETEQLSPLDELLVYATALGVGSKAVRALLEQVPEEEMARFVWYVPAASSRSAAGLGEALASMVSTVSSTMSSSTGAGGGASGGGGGGAGGSGGGAG